MNRFEPGTPRALLGAAAVALTLATITITVAAPAATTWGTREIGVLTQDDAVSARAPSPDGMLTKSVDVVVVRGTRLVPVMQSQASQPKPGLQG